MIDSLSIQISDFTLEGTIDVEGYFKDLKTEVYMDRVHAMLRSTNTQTIYSAFGLAYLELH